LKNKLVYKIAAYGSTVFAATMGDGVFLSNDGGDWWLPASTGLPNPFVTSFALSGTALFAGTIGSGVYRWFSGTLTWEPVNVGLNTPFILSLGGFGAGDLVYAGTIGNGIFGSQNNGNTWDNLNGASVNTGNLIVSAILMGYDAYDLFMAGIGKGIYFSTDRGSTWNTANTGLTNKVVTSFAAGSSRIFAGTMGKGVWYRGLPELFRTELTGVADVDLPAGFRLEQNYPNPFNPKTEIRYQISEAGMVRLAVFDVLGREVATLVNQQQSPGSYTASFDGNKLSSGVYSYRLTSGDRSEMKQMVLVK
jgi:hypothetical protein